MYTHPSTLVGSPRYGQSTSYLRWAQVRSKGHPLYQTQRDGASIRFSQTARWPGYRRCAFPHISPTPGLGSCGPRYSRRSNLLLLRLPSPSSGVLSGGSPLITSWMASPATRRTGPYRTAYGFLDMGGASTQIAFEPSLAERNNPENSLIEVRLRLLCGEEIVHKVFVTTWLGCGTNQARERYVVQAINAFESAPPIRSLPSERSR